MYTIANLYEKQRYKEVSACVRYLEDRLCTLGDLPSDRCEFVLHLKEDKGTCIQLSYYCVDHDSRRLFWLDECNLQNILQDYNGSKGNSITLRRLGECNFELCSQFVPNGVFNRLYC